MDGRLDSQNQGRTVAPKTALSKSVFRTATVLNCLSNGIGSVTEIAEICGLPKSTIHRILGELCEVQLTMQDPSSNQYYLGPLISEMAAKPIVTHESLIICAANEMSKLAGYTGETVGLAGLIGLKQISLHEIPSIHDFKIVVQKKVTEHMHAGATSRVLLAQITAKDLKLVLANMDFKALTETTITYKRTMAGPS
jgi:IclR family acetate operon transcriptional repressor